MPPKWYTDAVHFWSAGIKFECSHPDTVNATHDDFGVAIVGKRLILGAAAELRRFAIEREWKNSTVTLSLVDQVLRELPIDDIGNLVVRTFVLELNKERESGSLVGETPEERYQDYLNRLSDAASAQEFFRDYPVLLRLVSERLRYWIDRSKELLIDFDEDLPLLKLTIWDETQPQRVDRIVFGAGDSHNFGRTVAILKTDVGNIVFKPRDSQMEQAFSAVVNWFNQANPPFDLRVPKTVQGLYGTWHEFVDNDARTDSEGLSRFAWRQGCLTAILHILRTTDMHHENLVACGEYPVVTDLEALLHTDREQAGDGDDQYQGAGQKLINQSVLSVGIVPHKIVRSLEGKTTVTDISSVGSQGEQQGFMKVPLLVEQGRDTMHFVEGIPSFEESQNLPMDEAGSPTSVLDRGIDFQEGFIWAYETIMNDRDTWSTLLLPGFAECRTRLIARPTAAYAKILFDSFHPYFLHDAVDREMCLSKLLSAYSDREDRNTMIAAELDDMRRGDIPLFQVEVTSGRVIQGSTDALCGERNPAPMALAQKFLDEAGEADLSLQKYIIRHSFEAALVDRNGAEFEARVCPSRSDEVHDAKGEEHALTKVLLEELAEARVNLESSDWLSLTYVNEVAWTLAPIGFDLYNGKSGLLVSLLNSSGMESRDLARKLAFDLAQMARNLAGAAASMPQSGRAALMESGGGFGMLSGPVYALGQAATVLKEPTFIEAVKGLLPLLSEMVVNDNNNDIVSGNAGTLLSLMSLDQPDLVEGPVRAAVERLLDSATAIGHDMLAWRNSSDETLLGYSHGAIGVVYSLLTALDKGYCHNMSDRILETCSGALHYESSLFLPESGDWPDLRTINGVEGRHMRAWCHGAGGEILARARLARYPVAAPLEELILSGVAEGTHALAETLKLRPDGQLGIGNDCLCHGDIGNLICLAEVTAEQEVNKAQESYKTHALSVIKRRIQMGNLKTGFPGSAQLVGLMTGLAGVIWGLKYASEPSGPNLLMLDSAGTNDGKTPCTD